MIYLLYIIMFIVANFLVLKFGKIGIFIASSVFIPFDFVIRCYFQEKWNGRQLIFKMGGLILIASIISFLMNYQVKNIAIASFFSFLISQTMAAFIYQNLKQKSYLIKVNGSDFIAIITDSIIFQWIAFNIVLFEITATQVLIKTIGGIFWYFILFKYLKIQEKWNTL